MGFVISDDGIGEAISVYEVFPSEFSTTLAEISHNSLASIHLVK